MSRGTTSIGFRNQNKQVVVGPTGMPGTDHNSKAYELKCGHCGVTYRANGTDIYERKCPKCQGGRPGLSIPEGQKPAAKPHPEWAVADAKARFSEIIEKAAERPQTVTRNGKAVAVVVGIDEWARKTIRKGSLAEFLMSSPLRGVDIDFERVRDQPRELDL